MTKPTQTTDPDAWDQEKIRTEVAFCTSPMGRLRREDREVAFALEIERLRAILSEIAQTTNDEDEDAERAWFQGIDARRIKTKVTANPHSPGSRAWNCWRGAWMAEDHNIKEDARCPN